MLIFSFKFDNEIEPVSRFLQRRFVTHEIAYLSLIVGLFRNKRRTSSTVAAV